SRLRNSACNALKRGSHPERSRDWIRNYKKRHAQGEGGGPKEAMLSRNWQFAECTACISAQYVPVSVLRPPRRAFSANPAFRARLADDGLARLLSRPAELP